MHKYDDAAWHYNGDFPNGLERVHAATHIGFFLNWCIENNHLSDFQTEESKSDIEKVKNREMTGVEFLTKNCDERITDEDLNKITNRFAQDYYENDTEFSKTVGCYTDDYVTFYSKFAVKIKGSEDSIYSVENSWENYDMLKIVIDMRYKQWIDFRIDKLDIIVSDGE